MTEAIANGLLKAFKFRELVTALISMIPIIEVRGAIPFAMSNYFSAQPVFAWLYSFLGSCLIVPLLLLILLPFINFLRKTKAFRKLGNVLYERFSKGAANINKSKPVSVTADGEVKAKKPLSADFKKMLGVFIFVAIPLPMTGVWTGCAVAAVCGLKYHKSLIAVIAGNLVASGIVAAICALLQPLSPYALDYFTYVILIIAGLALIALIFKVIFSKRNTMMKRIVILTDGSADYPESNGDTPLSLAKKPNIDALSANAEVGLCQTVPPSLPPGSDVANLSVMGFDPLKYYTGRSPLEAASIGIILGEGDVTYRVNLVTLSNETDFKDKTMLDYSAGEIDTASANALIELLKPITPKGFELFAGVSYRHCLVERNAEKRDGQKTLTPPHDISGQKIADKLPSGIGADVLLSFMQKANGLLSSSPQNNTKANAVWIWGMGTKPALPDFKTEFGLSGAVISAVDLIKGIGKCAKMDVINVNGATGTLNTDFDAKAQAAIDALKTHDYVYLHLEAPDECGHQGDRIGKIKAIELIDEKVVGPIVCALKDNKDGFKMLILPDHATPLTLKTHTRDPIPYLLYDSKNETPSGLTTYTEATAKSTGIIIDNGPDLMKKLL